MTIVRVLVVEDDPRTVALHAEHVSRMPGLELVGTARSVQQAIRELNLHPEVDVVLLDFDLPDGHGLSIVRALRAAGHRSEVIAVTAERDVSEVQKALSHGVVAYIVKPFTFRIFRDKLQQYLTYRAGLKSAPRGVEQSEVDRLVGLLRPPRSELPKGLSAETLQAVLDVLRAAPDARSATEVAEAIGANRVTTRRYLEHLADTGGAVRNVRYGGRGRPELEYRAGESPG